MSWPKQLEVKEYTNASIADKYARPQETATRHQPLEFDLDHLINALARTTFARHLDDPSDWLEKQLADLTVQNIVEEKDATFKFIKDKYESLRDFSRTAKVGEMAQAISYIFAQKKLRYPYIVDFDLFTTREGIVVAGNDSTPDFILKKRKNGKRIALLESKGTMIPVSNLKGKLKKGLKQCAKGKKLLSSSSFIVENKYALCTEFSLNSETENSVVHYVDPEDVEDGEFNDDRIMRYHYASWFYMIGDFANARKLISNQTIQFPDSFFEPDTIRKINNDTFYILSDQYRNYFIDQIITIFSERFFLGNPVLFVPSPPFGLRIGISKKVVDMLSSQNRTNEAPVFEPGKYDGYEVFLDGTIFTIIEPAS